MTATNDDFLALARRHIQAEADMDIDTVLSTLVDDPHYEFYPMGIVLEGRPIIRRLYEAFLGRRPEFTKLIESQVVRNTWLGDAGYVEEYETRVRQPDGTVVTEALLAIVARAPNGLILGERAYTSERFLRLLWGDFYDEAAEHSANART